MKVRTLPPLRGPPSSLLSVSAAALHFLSVSTLRAEKALIRDGKKVPSVHPLMYRRLPTLQSGFDERPTTFPANYKPGTTNYPSPFPA